MKVPIVILFFCGLLSISLNSVGQNITIDSPVSNTVYNESDTILFSGTNIALLEGINMNLYNRHETDEYESFASFYPDENTWQVKVPASRLVVGDNIIYAEGGGGIRSNSISVCYLPDYNTARFARINNETTLQWDDWWGNNYTKPECNGGRIYYRIWQGQNDNSSEASTISSWIIGDSYTLPFQPSGYDYYYWIQAASNSGGSNATKLLNPISNLIIGSLDIDTENANFIWDGSDTITINVTSDVPWEASTSVSWVELINAKYANNGSFKIACKPNPSKSKRTAIIYMVGPYDGLKSITLEQDPGYLTFLDIDRNYFVFSEEGGSGSFTISNKGQGIMPWRLGNLPYWIEIPGIQAGVDTAMVEFIVHPNVSKRRSGSITVFTDGAQNSPQYITINQLENEFFPGWNPEIKIKSSVLYGSVSINGSPASNGDWIGAFNHEECIGIGLVRLQNDTAFVSMNIQLDETQEVTFKLWDKDTQEIFRPDLSIVISPQKIIGSKDSLVNIQIYKKPDLYAKEIRFNDSIDYEIGADIELKCKLENIGNLNASGFYVHFSIQKQNESAEILLDSLYVENIKKDSTLEFTKTIILPSDIPLGNYLIKIVVNKDKAIDELAFENNHKQISLDIVFNDFLCLFGDGNEGVFTGGVIDLSVEHNFESINVPSGSSITFIGDNIRAIKVLGDVNIDAGASIILRQLDDFHGELFSYENTVINLNRDELNYGIGGVGNGVGTSKGGRGGAIGDGLPGGCSCGNALGTYASHVKYGIGVTTPFNGEGGLYPGGNGKNAINDYCSWMYEGAYWTNRSYFSAGGGASGQHGLSGEKIAFIVGGKIEIHGTVEGQGTNGSRGGNGGEYSGVCAYYKGGLHQSASGGGGGGAGGAGGHGGNLYFLHQNEVNIDGVSKNLTGGDGGQGGSGGLGACVEVFGGTDIDPERAERGSIGGIGTEGDVHLIKIERPIPSIFPNKYIELASGDSVTLKTFGGKSFTYQWYQDDAILVGDTSSSLIVKHNGNYYCEISANNSCTISLLPVSVNVKPDIAIDNLSISKNEYAKDEELVFNYEISNLGEGFANGILCKYYLSKDTIIDDTDVLLSNRFFDTISPLKTNLIIDTISFPISLDFGNYFLFISSEVDTIYNESYLKNNIKKAPFKLVFDNIQCYDFGPESNLTFKSGVIDRSRDTTFYSINMIAGDVMNFTGEGDGIIKVLKNINIEKGAIINLRAGINQYPGTRTIVDRSINLNINPLNNGTPGIGASGHVTYGIGAHATGGIGGNAGEDGQPSFGIKNVPGGIAPGGNGQNGRTYNYYGILNGQSVYQAEGGGGGAGGKIGESCEQIAFVVNGSCSILGEIYANGLDGGQGGNGGVGYDNMGGAGGGGAGGGGGHGGNVFVVSFGDSVLIDNSEFNLFGGVGGTGGIHGSGFSSDICSFYLNGCRAYYTPAQNGSDGGNGEDGILEIIQLDSISKIKLQLIEEFNQTRIETFGASSLIYQWFLNGEEIYDSIQSSIFPNESGNYCVEVGQNGCGIFSDTISFVASIKIEQNISICEGETYNDHSISGTYIDSFISVQGLDSIVTTHLYVYPLPIVQLGNDTTIYSNESLILDAGENHDQYLWSNDSSGRWITIDGSKMLAGTYKYIVTVTNSNACSASDSITITIVELPSQLINLTSGWNWFSLNLEAVDMSIENLLSSLHPQAGDYIKDRKGTGNSAQFYDIPGTFTGWTGTLADIDLKETYKIKLSNEGVLSYKGYPVDISNIEIQVDAGWNWIGYPITFEMLVSEYLSTLDFTNGDYLKDQKVSTTYYDLITDWFGQLEIMKPGNGYVLNVSNAGSIHESANEYKASNNKNKEGVEINIPKYNVRKADFEFSGSATIEVFVDGANIGDTDNILYAFNQDGVCVGIINGLRFSITNKYLYNLMMYGNLTEGDEMHFKFFDKKNNNWYSFKERLAFTEDMIIADAFQPFELRNSMLDNLGIEKDIIKVYPNPFKDSFTYSFIVDDNSNVYISIFDSSGEIIEVLLDRLFIKGKYSFEWNNSKLSEGIYYLKIKLGDYKKTIPLIMLK